MDKQRVVEALNQALGEELALLTQTYWHYVMATGAASPALRERWREMSIRDMRHAEELAERIDHYGGIPTTQPRQVQVGGDLIQMIRDDVALKSEAVKMYAGYLDLVKDEPITYHLLLEILKEEESDLDELESWLSE